MLATPYEKVFDDDDWIFELKLDGYRAIAELRKNEILLYSRNGLSFLEKFPLIVTGLKKIKRHAILDGEIVLTDENGKPDFQKLQHYQENTHLFLQYYVFDLLAVDGKEVQDEPLLERKKMLKKIAGNNPLIRYCDHIEGQGKAFYKKVVAEGMEGIIAKRKDSVYMQGVRNANWLKIKNVHTHEAIICGYTAGRGSRKHFGALILGQYKNNQLQYIGHTGTGFNDQSLKDIWSLLQPLKSERSPFSQTVKVNAAVSWVKPKLVAELKYTAITKDGLMRHPVFLRLRPDQDAKTITMNKEKKVTATPAKKKQKLAKETVLPAESKELSLAGKKLVFTNLNKIFWPSENYTKADLIDYYDSVAEYILPYLKNRPLSLKRNPNGINDAGFYHKDAGGDVPAWIKKANIRSASTNKIIHYLVCNNKASLLFLANFGCIEFNPWNSLTTKLDKPSYLVIDIDPSKKNRFEDVIETALVTKAILDKAGAVSFCKTSGASGLHVYVPMGNKYDDETVRNFAHLIASLVVEQLPEITTLERSLAKRGDKKIYVDYLQNRRGQTLASAYSLRPVAGASVSTPLSWKEVKPGLDPLDFHIGNVVDRVKQKGDLFNPVLGTGVNLKDCLKRLDIE